MDAGDRPPSSSGAADDAGVHPHSTSGDAAESDADLAVPARVADFSGVRAWLPRADTRLSRVLGTALRDAGCAVHGARAGGEELAFAAETFVAATELHNPEHERARRACVRACHLAVATLPGDAGEIRSLAEALTSAARADGTKRALIVVSPPRAVVGRATRASSASASNARARDGKTAGAAGAAARSPPGDAGVCADAERVALRLHRPGSLEVFVLRHGVLYGEGEFADGFLGVMRAAWEGRSVPVFGAGDNVLRLCHARKLAEGVVRVAARALLGVVMRSDGAESGPSSQGLRVTADADDATKTEAGEAEKSRGSRLAEPSEPSFSTPSPPSSPPRVLGVCDAYGQTDTPPMTQIEIASRIASAFETNIRRFPASRAALFELGASEVWPKPHPSRFVPGARTLEDGRGGCESLLLRFEEDAELDDATRAHAAMAGEEDARADLSATARAVTGRFAATGRLEPRSLGGSSGGVGVGVVGALGGGDFRLPASESSSRSGFASDPASQADATFAASARAFETHFPGAAETNPLRFGESFGAFSFEDAHFGSMGDSVEHPFHGLLAARAAEEAVKSTSGPDADPTTAVTEEKEKATDAEEASGEEEETLWEPAPAKIGGARAIRDAFVRENGLEPIRVVIRGPPLSRADHLGFAIAEAYAVPLLTPASMVRSFLPRAPDELREKCGDPTWKPRPETEAGEEAGEEAGSDPASPDAPGHLPDADPAALARAEARAEEEAHALFDALDGATKLDLLAFTLDDAAVKKAGYVMAGGVPADPETCASLFTWIPPRPPLRLKEGWDAPRVLEEKTGEEGDAEKTDAEKTADEPVVEPVEEPPYPEESEEEAESRRDAHPDRAPNLHLRLVFDDGGVYAKKVKRVDSEGYAAYVTWAEAEDAARDAHEAATEARE